MKIIAVLAMTPERLVGKNGELPWHIPEDLKHFQELTIGKVVAMGKNTYFSLPKKYRPLPRRRNIVLSRGEFSECESFSDIKSLIQSMKTENIKELYIIGGVQIYKAFFEAGLVDRVECTLITGDYFGDAYLPEWRNDFILESEIEFKDGSFQIYKKIKKGL